MAESRRRCGQGGTRAAEWADRRERRTAAASSAVQRDRPSTPPFSPHGPRIGQRAACAVHHAPCHVRRATACDRKQPMRRRGVFTDQTKSAESRRSSAPSKSSASHARDRRLSQSRRARRVCRCRYDPAAAPLPICFEGRVKRQASVPSSHRQPLIK